MHRLLAALRGGDRLALSKAITLVESTLASDKRKAAALLSRLPPRRQSIRVGVTGAPGVGKSTFTESIGSFLLDHGRVQRMAVVAVDPSSEVSGGSILGDKTRMPTLALHPRAFVRPSPARGALGGVALATDKVARLCETAGFDLVWIETVGAGQSETAVARMADVMVLLVAPNSGDDLQGMKKGIVELADIIVVNKADCGAAEQTVAFYSQAVGLSGDHRAVQRRTMTGRLSPAVPRLGKDWTLFGTQFAGTSAQGSTDHRQGVCVVLDGKVCEALWFIDKKLAV